MSPELPILFTYRSCIADTLSPALPKPLHNAHAFFATLSDIGEQIGGEAMIFFEPAHKTLRTLIEAHFVIDWGLF